MGSLVLTHHLDVDAPVDEALRLVASRGPAEWRLPAPGAWSIGSPVSLPVTLPDPLGGGVVNVLGRIDSTDGCRHLRVRHSLPWQGIIDVSAKPFGAALSRVRVTSRLEEGAIAWASARLGIARPVDARPDVWRVGVITSATGPASVFCAASVDLASLAIEEANADGRLGGRRIELIVGDDGTHPGLGAAEVVRLAMAGCRVIVTNVTGRTFQRLRPVARRFGVLLVHAILNEGGTEGSEVLRMGERPSDQLSHAMRPVAAEASGNRWYLAGSEYSFPRVAHRIARRILDRNGGVVAGDRHLSLGSTDFSPIIESIQRSGADSVLSTFVGADEVAFQRQFHDSGLRQRVQMLSLAMEESTSDYIGSEAAEGIWSSFAYFQQLQTSENISFLRRYRSRFGPAAAPVSSLSVTLYEGLHMVVLAARAARSIDPADISARLQDGIDYTGPRGPRKASSAGQAPHMYLARTLSSTVQPVSSGPPAHH